MQHPAPYGGAPVLVYALMEVYAIADSHMVTLVFLRKVLEYVLAYFDH